MTERRKSSPADPEAGRAGQRTVTRTAEVPSLLAPIVSATVHPSSILRAPDDETRREEMRRFVEDLRTIAREMSKS
jgi:DNA polymerase